VWLRPHGNAGISGCSISDTACQEVALGYGTAMQHKFRHAFLVAAAVSILCGCGDSKSTTAGGDSAAAPAREAAAPEAVKAAVEATKATVSDLTAQFSKAAAAQSDQVLGSIGGDLATKVKSLGESLGANEAVKTQLDNTLQSLLAGQDSAAVNSVFQVAQAANLTPQQVGLAKEVGNLASAYAVQRNFSALDGAQGDVATIVNSLRKGEIAAAVPPIQKISQNANLTAPQKELIGSLADTYAPGLKKVAGSLQQGLKGLPGTKP